MLQAELTRARAAGATRLDMEPEDCAILLVSLVQGLAIRWSMGNRAFSLETEGSRLLVEQLKLFFVPPRQEGNA
jgi:hypothetical protein